MEALQILKFLSHRDNLDFTHGWTTSVKYLQNVNSLPDDKLGDMFKHRSGPRPDDFLDPILAHIEDDLDPEDIGEDEPPALALAQHLQTEAFTVPNAANPPHPTPNTVAGSSVPKPKSKPVAQRK